MEIGAGAWAGARTVLESGAAAGPKRAFGEDCVPVSYDDLEQADLIVLVGPNTAWCHPVICQRILAAKEVRPQLRIVVVDPRRTATCEAADLHLPIRTGSDGSLFNGLLVHLDEQDIADNDFIVAHVTNAAAAVEVARVATGDVGHAARACGVDEALLRSSTNCSLRPVFK